ncbi:helix-turn-helix domain-containing protein [Roseospira marina]|uniref:Helix-turn-helix domain-containing protein n=1 Tax=Roseospira marina TaxID=140057 RepID=A0A5M6IEF6_9PROT|nr:helix-turn-helix domain-containing protein [Roseospira marina]KAA5606347.1 helix-turn-helix domain-containing protein [Roseospira marina]MBB4314255.1 putative DNA-binding transcriptional regulator AlpA [Roseospira marina]MBB5087415.1 putative DNA-binding transcriptional regulator AlpA [Roseospira marina]
MAATLHDLSTLPNWPRLLSEQQAAAYCGVTGETFRRHIPVAPRRLGRRVLYDRRDIDRWLDGADENGGPIPEPADLGSLFA